MRKIYVVLVLIIILTVFSFANGWLNAQNEIQNSFNANSPSQNLQNQLLSSTNTNNSFLNLSESSVGILSKDPSTYSFTKCVSGTGATTITISLSSLSGLGTYPHPPYNYAIAFNSNDITLNSYKINYSNSIPSKLILNVNVNSLPSSATIILSAGYWWWWWWIDLQDWNIELNLVKCQSYTYSYVATAVSYNASFCGVSGNPLTGLYNTDNTKMLLAQLFIESNATDVTLTVSTSTTLPPGALTFYYSSLTNPGWNNSSIKTLTLSTTNVLGSPTFNTLGSYSGSSPESLSVTPIYKYTGTAQVYANANSSNWSLTKWVTAGQYTVNITFTITPKGSY